MEKLLNKLIEKGWKPRWENNIKDMYVSKNNFYEDIVWVRWSKGWCTKRWWTFRELVSKESWLWQFVCENGMRPKRPWYEEHIWQRDGKTNWDRCILENEYQYYLIESALCDEDKLEEFLLNSIKLD